MDAVVHWKRGQLGMHILCREAEVIFISMLTLSVCFGLGACVVLFSVAFHAEFLLAG